MKNYRDFDFNDLFIFDLANNHQGDVEHAKSIIDEVSKFSNLIFIHKEIDEPFDEIKELAKKNNCRIGIVLHAVNNYDNDLEKVTDNFEDIMILCIPKAGFSGQKFEEKS